LADELRIRLSEYRGFEAGRVELSVLHTSLLKRVLAAAGVAFDEDGRVQVAGGEAVTKPILMRMLIGIGFALGRRRRAGASLAARLGPGVRLREGKP